MFRSFHTNKRLKVWYGILTYKLSSANCVDRSISIETFGIQTFKTYAAFKFKMFGIYALKCSGICHLERSLCKRAYSLERSVSEHLKRSTPNRSERSV